MIIQYCKRDIIEVAGQVFEVLCPNGPNENTCEVAFINDDGSRSAAMTLDMDHVDACY